MLIVRSPVRISFGGGGTDLPSYYLRYGGGVLSASINKYFYTVVSRRSDEQIQIISSDLRVIESWEHLERMPLVPDHQLALPIAVLKGTEKISGIDLFLASEIPPGTGLGSSASVCVNLIKATAMFLGKTQSRYELAERAFHIAREILHKPVGKQDEYAAAFGGLNFISFGTDDAVGVDPLHLERGELQALQSRLMLFFTGAGHNSWSILQRQEQATQEEGSSGLRALHEIRLLAEEMRQALQAGAWSAFGALMDRSWQHKRSISDQVSTPRIDYLYECARKAGAAGGKITGAGGGGYLLLYCEEERQQRVREALANEELREMRFAFDTRGTQVIANDPFLDGDRANGLRWSFMAPEAR